MCCSSISAFFCRAMRNAARVREDYKRLPYPISPEFFVVTRDGVAGTLPDMPEQSSEAA